MRRACLKLVKKLQFRWYFFYTWMHKGDLKRCGRGACMEYPVRLEELHAISLGNDVKIARGTWINPVGEWSGTKYGGEIVIGDRTWISYDVQISAARSVVIEEDVVIASGAVIVDHLHDHSYIDKPIFMSPLTQPDPVRIGKGSFLGVNCFIGPGVQIGEHAVIGANAVVTKNVPSYCIAVGIPARMHRFHKPKPVAQAADDDDVADRAREVRIG